MLFIAPTRSPIRVIWPDLEPHQHDGHDQHGFRGYMKHSHSPYFLIWTYGTHLNQFFKENPMVAVPWGSGVGNFQIRQFFAWKCCSDPFLEENSTVHSAWCKSVLNMDITMCNVIRELGYSCDSHSPPHNPHCPQKLVVLVSSKAWYEVVSYTVLVTFIIHWPTKNIISCRGVESLSE